MSYKGEFIAAPASSSSSIVRERVYMFLVKFSQVSIAVCLPQSIFAQHSQRSGAYKKREADRESE